MVSVIEDRTTGFDGGIASMGWSVINWQDKEISAGVWMFNSPEEKTKSGPVSKNANRREKRLARRQTKRRAGRMGKTRQFFEQSGLLQYSGKNSLQDTLKELNRLSKENGGEEVTPWSLRVDGLNRKLEPAEWAIILAHFTKHAGFQSNKKTTNSNAASEDKKALKAMDELADKLANWRTFGEALQCDPGLNLRKRNRSGDYSKTPKRSWLIEELRILIERQSKYGNTFCGTEFLDRWNAIAFTRKPLGDSYHLVGSCPFEEDERRASKFAPSFEKFRYFSKVRNLKINPTVGQPVSLTNSQLQNCANIWGSQKTITFATLRRVLDLPDTDKFVGVPTDKEGRDICLNSGASAAGTSALMAALSKEEFSRTSEALLDKAMFSIAFGQTSESIRSHMQSSEIPQGLVEALMPAVERGDFAFVSGAAHISAKACRNILEGLKLGMRYDEACTHAGYDHSQPEQSPFVRLRAEFDDNASISERKKKILGILNDPKNSPIQSPVARKAVTEMVKQFSVVCQEHFDGNLPAAVHIELARELGKSIEERDKITAGINARNQEVEKQRTQFEDTFRRPPHKNELRVFELAQEQGWRCLYTDACIDPHKLFDGVSFQVDHILPWSRFGDNSFNNLTLCSSTANQAKGNQTPFEWFGNETTKWEEYEARVMQAPGVGRRATSQNLSNLRGFKYRNYLLKDAKEREEGFRNRNLNDTRWAARVGLQAIEAFYPEEIRKDGTKVKRVFARPGPLTDLLRRAWGIQGLKKDEKTGKRIPDDRHHGVDAIIVAATSNAELQKLTKAVQQAECLGKPRMFEAVHPPWPTFPVQVISAFESIRVARPERRRARGALHAENLQGFNPHNGVVFARKYPNKLINAKLSKEIEDGEVNPDELENHIAKQFLVPERSKQIIGSIVEWGLKGMPSDHPPLDHRGNIIGKVKVIETGSKPAILVTDKAFYDRSSIVRTDVFSKLNKKGKAKFYLVPVYPHQIDYPSPPNQAIAAHKPESDWIEIDSTYEFKFSLFPFSWISICDNNNQEIEGYYRSVHRSTGTISVSAHNNSQQMKTGIGGRTLKKFEKLTIDRMGNSRLVRKETREWRGVACT